MYRASSRSYDFLWMNLALFILLPIAFFLSISPHDYWFYVRIGKDILETGAIPTTDTFSFTYPGRPIYYQPWLSAVIFWVVHSIGGATLTFLLKGICIGIAYGMIWTLLRAADTEAKIATLLTVLLGLSSSTNWSMRPQILAYPLFAITLWIIWHWQHGRARKMWMLPFLSLLWANLHGSFVLIFVLMGSALLFGAGNRKKLALWMVISLLATLINPRGIYVWQFVSDMLTSPSDQLFATEWWPPINAGWQMNIFFAWLLLFVPLAALSSRHLSRLEWIWFLGFGWLALSGLRYVIWFMFLMALFTGPPLTELSKRFLGEAAGAKTNPFLNFVLGGLMLLLPLMMLPGVRETWWKDAPPAYHPATTPIAAAEWLAAHPHLPGPLFAEYTFGSYLTFALPSRLLWIDNRFNAYPPEHWKKYQMISSAKYNWESLLDEDSINLLMLSTHTQPDLIQAVKESSQWCEAYRDADAVIFVRCEPLP
ncbi:MAG TPA: hypothetical protein VNK49_05180 [Anaerolineales bacterium]|nr:hypothetical protein [Anaerolineales bacterium]